MLSNRAKLTRNLTAALLVAAAAAPAAGSASPDLNYHDAGYASTVTAGGAGSRVPYSPDARDRAAAAVQPVSVPPDVRDNATAARRGNDPDVLLDAGRAVASVPASQANDPRPTDWDDEGIIAGGAFGLMLLGLGVAIVAHRNSTTRQGRNPAALG